MDALIDFINGIIWSNALIVLCLFTGIYFSIRTRFLQIRHIKNMIRLLFTGKASKEGVSSFQAFAIAISGRIGVGNIAGVATAIAMGGPGAIFWMWVIAFVGAASAFVEATLGQIYKEVRGGQYRGGPAYYIDKGLGLKWYAYLFVIATLIATAFLLPGIQSNSIASGMEQAFNIKPLYSGIAVAILIATIIFGGVKRIGKAAELIVPFMAIGYILVAVYIIFANITEVPAMFKLIIDSAFGIDAGFGAIVGSAIAWGVKRGVYSNEAGQGTAPHAASAAEVSHPAQQGLVQAFSVYIDTLFVCTATALIILFSGKYNAGPFKVIDGEHSYFSESLPKADDPTIDYITHNLPGVGAGTEFTQHAIEHYIPGMGEIFVAIALFFFAFTTIMAYYYIAETNLNFLYPNRINPIVLLCLRLVLIGTIIYGTINSAGAVWDIGDIGVGIMAWLNIIAILLLSKPALKTLKDYEAQRKAGKRPVFDPEKLGIKNTEAWNRKKP